jgi:MFS family permease
MLGAVSLVKMTAFMSRSMARLAQLPKTVWLLGLISLLNDSASELVYPLLPLYFASVLMLGPRFIGLLEGIAESATAILKLLAGALSDRFRSYKLPLFLGYGLAALARPLFALASSFIGVFALRMLDRLGKALRSAPRDALLAASVAPEKRGLAFGLHRSMDHLGAVIGPLLAWLLLAQGFAIADVLRWSIVPGVLCMAMVLALPTPATPAHSAPKPAFSLSFCKLPQPLRRYYLTLALFSLGNASNMFLLLHTQSLGLSAADTMLCWALMSLIATVLTAPLAGWSDRIGRFHLIAWGWASYALIYLLFARVSADWIWLVFASYGLFLAATEGAEKALVADFSEQRAGGQAFGWFHLAAGLPLLPASLIFGELSARGYALWAFWFCSLCAVSAALLLLFWVRPAQRAQATNRVG